MIGPMRFEKVPQGVQAWVPVAGATEYTNPDVYIEESWTPVSAGLPEPGRPMNVVVQRASGGRCVIRAMWIPQFFDSELGDYNGDADYCEAKDQYYWPEGWYERNEFDEMSWAVDGIVTHWRPLPPLPEDHG